MGQFSENHRLLKRSPDEVDTQSSPITSEEMDFMTIRLQEKKSPGQMVSLEISTKKNYDQFYTISSRKQTLRGNFPAHFMRPYLSDKQCYQTKDKGKLQSNVSHEIRHNSCV